jgi:two-component system, NarL family, nitrate/nitrite response regulator NarL
VSGRPRTFQIRVVITIDHTLFRTGLRKLLESKAHLKVVGEAASGWETVALVRKLKPDLLLLDARLPNLSELDVLRQLPSSSVTRVIVLTESLETKEIVQVFGLNARGIVLKGAATQSIFSGIDAVMSGQYWIYNSVASGPEDALTRLPERELPEKFGPRQFDLTQREFDVLKALASCYTNREIAARLSISEQTVKHHVTNIFNKTGTSNRVELVRLAIEQKIVDIGIRRESAL